MSNAFKYQINVHIGSSVKTLTEVELGEYANQVGLDRVAPGRYSWLFVAGLMVHEEANGISPSMIIDELKALESGTTTGTKPATEFTKAPLKGLWHKHYFSAHFIGQNLVNQHAGGRLEKLVERVMDPEKYPIVTRELIGQFAHEVVQGAFEQREEQGKLTGEWIVFAKHADQNYYLCLATHNTGDPVIYDQIKSVCFPQFPFLAPVV